MEEFLIEKVDTMNEIISKKLYEIVLFIVHFNHNNETFLKTL
jgi:hypothetical protein